MQVSTQNATATPTKSTPRRKECALPAAAAAKAASDAAPATATKKAKLTPLEQQVAALKEKHPGVFLLVECGYKYCFFGEASVPHYIALLTPTPTPSGRCHRCQPPPHMLLPRRSLQERVDPHPSMEPAPPAAGRRRAQGRSGRTDRDRALKAAGGARGVFSLGLCGGCLQRGLFLTRYGRRRPSPSRSSLLSLG